MATCRVFAPQFWARTAARMPCFRGPVVFDLGSGRYRALSDRAAHTLHEVKDSVAGLTSLLAIKSEPASARGRSRNGGRAPLL